VSSEPQDCEPSSIRRVAYSDQDDTVRQEQFDSVLNAFRRLVEAAADTGRDWKLVDALLQTMVELVLETQGDLFISTGVQSSEPSTFADGATPSAEPTAAPKLRLRPEYRLRFEAVIDSWSDDEAARFLAIGTRQIRRRAKQGSLYFFVVNRKRRYPVWQFNNRRGVLGDVAQVGRALPDSWTPQRVYAFMTTRSPDLKMITPAQWMLLHRNPDQIVSVIAKSEG